MRIAVAQILSGTDPADNLQIVRDYAGRAAEAGASLVVFPEAAHFPHIDLPEQFNAAVIAFLRRQ